MIVTYLILALVVYVLFKYLRKFIAYRKAYFKLPMSADYRYTTGTLHAFPGNNEEGLTFDYNMALKNCYFHLVWAGPFIPACILYHPDAIRPILKSSAPKSRNTFLATPYDMGLRWLGEGLLIANGAKWARSRRLLTPAFHFEILKPYVDVYNQCADILIEKIEGLARLNQSFDIYTLINLDALDVILRCAFSYISNCQTSGSGSAYIDAIGQLQAMWADRSLKPHLHNEFIYSLTSHGKKFYRLCDVAHQVAEEIIEKRRKELEKEGDQISQRKVKDFLDTLLTARDEDGNGLNPLEIRNEVDTFLFEGHDTTASGMSWTLYCLAQHPEYQERVYDEVIEVLQGREHLEWNDLAKLEFTTMCIKEALRLHTAVPFIERRTNEECEIQGHIIPAGTRVAIHIWILHHNPHLWEDPHSFNPERFHPDNQQKMDPFQFVPFSAGSRNCIGQNFAMNEMKVTVSRVIQRFKLSVDPMQKCRRTPSVTMKAENGIYIYAHERL